MPARLSEALQFSKQVMMDSGSLDSGYFYRAPFVCLGVFLGLRALYPGDFKHKLHLMFGSCRMLHKLQ